MWQVWLVFLLGVWVFISGFVPSAVSSAGHNIFMGVLIGLLALWAGLKKKHLQWLNFLLAAWLVASAFLFHSLWNNIAVGLVIAALAVVDASS